METLGSFLKRSRQLRSISQEELAKATCYHISKIEALEEDRHENLPVKPYVKGMLRSVSKYLGLDVNDVLLRYEEFLNSQKSPTQPESVEILEPPFYMKKNFLLIAASLSFLVLVVVVSLLFKGSQKLEPLGGISLPSTVSEGDKKDIPSIAGGYKLLIQAPRDIWLKIQIDSDPPYPLAIKEGTSFGLQARKILRFFVSDAEGLKLTLNDKEIANELKGAQTFVFP